MNFTSGSFRNEFHSYFSFIFDQRIQFKSLHVSLQWRLFGKCFFYEAYFLS